jgi:hypothetical protein
MCAWTTEAQRHKEVREADLIITGIRGQAADSGRDVDPSDIKLFPTSSRPLPILRMGAGAIAYTFALRER